MIKIQIELPDATAEAAQAAGLLTSEALDRLLSNAIRRQQAAGGEIFMSFDRQAVALLTQRGQSADLLS